MSRRARLRFATGVETASSTAETASLHPRNPLAFAQMRVIEPVEIGLVLPCAAVAAPGRVELKHVELDWVPHVCVTALQHAVEPPLEHAGRTIGVPFDAVPLTKRDHGGV